jgi:hypothetical protein
MTKITLGDGDISVREGLTPNNELQHPFGWFHCPIVIGRSDKVNAGNLEFLPIEVAKGHPEHAIVSILSVQLSSQFLCPPS